MLYYFAKYSSQIALRINFKKLFIHYRQPVPDSNPIIFAANHPTAFLDPVILGALHKRPMHFIVRGDIFKGGLILAALRGLKMLPIFRFRDGFSNLKNNQATMETVYDKLEERNCVLVLAEGETKHEKRLRPVQKGTARMAFGALEAHGEMDVLIVPIGVNYTDSHQLRSQVMVEFGAPIRVRDYLNVHEENPRKAIKQVTDRIQKEMRELIIHIEDPEDDVWVNRFLDIERNQLHQPNYPIVSEDDTLWKLEYYTVEKINKLPKEEREQLKNQLANYDATLAKYDTVDEGIEEAAANGLWRVMLLIIGLIPFLVGFIFNYLPIAFAKNLAKQKVKKIEFYASVRYGAAKGGYLIYFLLLLIIALFVGNPWIIGFVMLIPVFGYLALRYTEMFKAWRAGRSFQSLDPEIQESIIAERDSLLEAVNAF
jgi:1-acyl-sn-glycerol-3-phosphate acyltransferase